MMSRADRIAQELLDLIVAEYKGDNSYLVSCEKKDIDEEIFAEKFPFTLDKRPEPEPEFRPPSAQSSTLSSATKPKPKQKTAKDIADEQYMVKHNKEQADLRTQQAGYREYLDFLVKRVDLAVLCEQLDAPITQNPLSVLEQIQAYEDEEQPVVEEPGN